MAQNQAYLFLVFSLTGVVIGVLFDFFRILRRSIKTSNTITYIEDILFWILTGILILYSIWFFNNVICNANNHWECTWIYKLHRKQ